MTINDQKMTKKWPKIAKNSVKLGRVLSYELDGIIFLRNETNQSTGPWAEEGNKKKLGTTR